jgi:hypothetical protein
VPHPIAARSGLGVITPVINRYAHQLQMLSYAVNDKWNLRTRMEKAAPYLSALSRCHAYRSHRFGNPPLLNSQPPLHVSILAVLVDVGGVPHLDDSSVQDLALSSL